MHKASKEIKVPFVTLKRYYCSFVTLSVKVDLN